MTKKLDKRQSAPRSVTCVKCTRKADELRSDYLTVADLNRLEVALRLRVESLDDQLSGTGFNEPSQADKKRMRAQLGGWRGTHSRILRLIELAKGEKSDG